MSYGIDVHAFCRIAYLLKLYQLLTPANSSDAEARVVCKSTTRVRQFRLLLTSISFSSPKLTKVYENDKVVIKAINSNRITLRLCNIDLLL